MITKRTVMAALTSSATIGALGTGLPAGAQTAAGRPVDPAAHAALTEKNRKIMEQVAQALFIENDAAKFGTFVSDEEYIQHNPEIANGKKAVVEYLSKAFESLHGDLVGAVRAILVDGDLAVTHSYFRRKDGKPGGMVLADFFRLRDGKLVEHWDVIQQMPTTSANPHPMI